MAHAIPERRRHFRRLVAKDLLNPAAIEKLHAIQQVALTHLVPAAVERRAVVLRLFDRQLLRDLLALFEVTNDPSSKLHVQRMDHLGRQRLFPPEAGLHEVLVHMLQHILGMLVVPLAQLRCHSVQAGDVPHFLVALLRGVLVEVVEVVVKIPKF